MTSSKKVHRLWLWIVAAVIVCLLFFGARFFFSERKAMMPPANSGPVAVAPEKVEVLEFSDATLAEAARRFAVASGIEINVAPEIAMIRISGKFKVGEVERFMRILPQALPVRVEADSEKRFRIRSK